ncbi:hypothetical protein [Acinetobacter ursingii]|uniref:hypothetical protein n=1 Tax=Acinetobacter ursingii TaxID=108980 RepID=UPI00195BF164|nr:hypothetical protein [Acinetobacter ursingii]VTX88068.1 Uncharacterised protein [Acinetobacter ursingii]
MKLQILLGLSVLMMAQITLAEAMLDSSNTQASSNNATKNALSHDDEKIKTCTKQAYTGDSSDPQIYTFDYIAQVAQCSYRATENTDYLTYGDSQCQVLNGLLSSINHTFKPQYCSGSKMIK